MKSTSTPAQVRDLKGTLVTNLKRPSNPGLYNVKGRKKKHAQTLSDLGHHSQILSTHLSRSAFVQMPQRVREFDHSGGVAGREFAPSGRPHVWPSLKRVRWIERKVTRECEGGFAHVAMARGLTIFGRGMGLETLRFEFMSVRHRSGRRDHDLRSCPHSVSDLSAVAVDGNASARCLSRPSHSQWTTRYPAIIADILDDKAVPVTTPNLPSRQRRLVG